MKILHALETPDGQWRVEVIQRGKDVAYRLTHGESIVDGLAIATLERLLGEVGVDMAELVDVTDRPPTPQVPRTA